MQRLQSVPTYASGQYDEKNYQRAFPAQTDLSVNGNLPF